MLHFLAPWRQRNSGQLSLKKVLLIPHGYLALLEVPKANEGVNWGESLPRRFSISKNVNSRI